jgi:hypothetical protein
MAYDERSRLIAEYNRATRSYFAAVRELTKRIWTIPLDRLKGLKRGIDTMRLECERARLALEWHTASHKCDTFVD